MPQRVFRIGTRPSQLAMWQAKWIAARLGAPTEVIPIRTSGDKQRDRRFEEFGIQGIFTKELELALMDNRVDIAVHSLKDVPTQLPEGLALAAVTERGPVSDALLVHPSSLKVGLPIPVRRPGTVGTSSQRRSALLNALAQDLAVEPLRGNVPTRVQACRDKRYDAVLLARAGIERLSADTDPLNVFELDPETWIPAPGQAALALETRADDALTRRVARKLGSPDTHLCTSVERAMLAHFATGCHAPFAAWATVRDEEVTLRLGLGSSSIPGEHSDSNPWRTARVSISAGKLDEIDAPTLKPSELATFLMDTCPPQWSTPALLCGTQLCRPLAPKGK